MVVNQGLSVFPMKKQDHNKQTKKILRASSMAELVAGLIRTEDLGSILASGKKLIQKN
jgi:hypothetical protein